MSWQEAEGVGLSQDCRESLHDEARLRDPADAYSYDGRGLTTLGNT